MRTVDLPIRPIVALVAAVGLLLAACGDDETADETSTGSGTAADVTEPTDAGGDAAADGSSITISDFTFEPTELSVAPGTEVTIVNEDGTEHTATSTEGGFDSGAISGGDDGTLTAPGEPGEYPFFCNFHSTMKGTLVVG